MSEFAGLLNIPPSVYVNEQSNLYESNFIDVNNESYLKLQISENNSKIDMFENEQVLVIIKGFLLNQSEDNVAKYLGKEYLQKGTNLFNELDGTFAIALLDKNSDEVHLLTDPFGKQNLYYSVTENKVFFTSSLSGINIDSVIPKRINKAAVRDFFTYYFIPAPLTIYENIYKLLPSELITYSMKEKHLKRRKYWTIQTKEINNNKDKIKNKVREKVINNVDRFKNKFNITSSFLSGGIDSTIISGILAELSNQRIDTFTLGYEDNKLIDESDLARAVAKHHNSHHHVFFLKSSDVREEYRNIIGNLDEPFADSSMIPTYFISKYALSYGSADLLSGDGGDELFAGYNRYDSLKYARFYSKIPKIIRSGIINPISSILPQNNSSKIGNLNTKFQKLTSAIEGTSFEIYHRYLMMLTKTELSELLKNNNINQKTYKQIKKQFNNISTSEDIEKMMYTDLFFNLPNDVLYKVMKMSDIANVHTYSPLLEKSLVNMSFSIPLKYKMHKSAKKIIFKETFKEHIPSIALNAPKKGFGVPIGEWFRTELKTEFIDAITRNKVILKEYLNFTVLEDYINEHMLERNNYSHLLWSVFVFVIWLEENF